MQESMQEGGTIFDVFLQRKTQNSKKLLEIPGRM